MIIIIAAQNDGTAHFLTARWQAYGARQLTPRDLSTSGWRYQPHAGRDSTAVIGGRPVSRAEIAGVLTRLPWVSEHDLPHVLPHDRIYVASEMTAFLCSWLNELECPVLNRPTPTCLAGPAWRREQWVHLARRLGIPVCPVHRRTGQYGYTAEGDLPRALNTVTVVAGRCFGTTDSPVTGYAESIARAAGVDLLAAHFTYSQGVCRLASADLWPDVTTPAIADAILAYLGGRTC